MKQLAPHEAVEIVSEGGELVRESFCDASNKLLSSSDLSIRIFPFLRTFLENQLSPLTRSEYERDIHAFGNYLVVRFPEVHHPRELTRHHIIRYKLYLESQNLASATIGRKLSAISSYFHFLLADEVIHKDLTLGVKRPPNIRKKETASLSADQIERIFSSIDVNSVTGIFHHALLSTLFGTGLRSAAMRYVRFGDLADDQGIKIVRVTTKGGQKTIHPLRQEVWDSIFRYINALENGGLRLNNDDYVFQPPPQSVRRGRKGKPLSSQGLNSIFKRYCGSIGLTESNVFRYSPHSSRVSFATNLSEAGIPIEDIQDELGHKDIRTTKGYIKKTPLLQERATFKLPYFSNSKKPHAPET